MDDKSRIGAYVTVDEANDYINNHIANYFDAGKYPVKSLIFDAEMLRRYLMENPNIENMKFMLGVRPDGSDNGSITMVIVGYDAEGNYIKTDGDKVLDQCMPCPYNCPTHGNASNDNII